MSKQSTLISLALLKTSLDLRRQDYLDYLRPFVLHALHELRQPQVAAEQVQHHIEQDSGLMLPLRVVELVLKRLCGERVLERAEGLYRTRSRLPDPGLAPRRADAKRHIDAVIHSLLEYSQGTPTPLQTEDEALDALLSFLSEFSIDCLRTFVQATALPRTPDRAMPRLVLVSLFVEHISKTSPERFGSLVVLVEGHMMANALLCPDLGSLKGSFKKTFFYLDTPLVIGLLGLEGSPKQQAAEEMIRLVKGLGGRFAVFSHTYTEIERVIRGAAEHVDLPSARGAIVAEMRRQGRSRSDLLLVAAELEEALRRYEISVVRTPRYDPSFQIDERAFEGVLTDEIQYFNPQARLFDINSVRSIYALRHGFSPQSLETARAVLVTTNNAFARATDRYGREIEESREVSAVITDFSLANIAWLKSPVSAPQLPRKELLALAYAAIEPSDTFWSHFVDEAAKIEKQGSITPRQLELLRCSPVSRRAAMDLTLGDQKALSPTTVAATLRRIEDAIRAEDIGRLRAEAQSHGETRRQLTRLESMANRSRRIWDQKCLRLARWVAHIVIWLPTSCAMGGLVFFTSRQIDGMDWKVRLFSPLGVLILSGFVLVYILPALGLSVTELDRRLRSRLHLRLFRFVEHHLLLDTEAGDDHLHTEL